MNLRGLEVLLGTLGGVLLILGITSGLTLAALGWAAVGVLAILIPEAILVRHLLPYYRATRNWARVAAAMPGLRLLGDGGRTPPRLRGTVGSCPIRIDQINGGWKTTVGTHERPERADVQVSLRWAEGQRGRWRTGDRRFDRLVEVQGQVPEALLALDRATRRAVLEALADGIEVHVNRLVWCGPTVLSPAQAAARLDRMTALARRLFILTPAELRDRARRTVCEDPEGEVRARTLWLYREHYALAEGDAELIEAALSDPDDAVRLAAAGAKVAMNEVDPEAESMLAEAVARGEIPRWALSAAVDRLVEYGSPEVVTAAMQARLQNDGALPVAVLRWALRQSSVLDAETLGRRLLEAPPADACAAVEPLVQAGPNFEPTLIALLEHGSDRVVDRAISGLAFCGTARSVYFLKLVVRNLRRPRRVRHAATDALAAVRARGPEVAAGQLSLTDPLSPDAGLSFADDA